MPCTAYRHSSLVISSFLVGFFKSAFRLPCKTLSICSLAISEQINTSPIKFSTRLLSDGSRESNARTSVGLSFPLNLRFKPLINFLSTTIISQDFRPSALLAAFKIFPGKNSIPLCRFVSLTFNRNLKILFFA